MNRTPSRLRLVLSGYYGRGNLGDEAILAGIVSAIRELEPDAGLTAISATPIATRANHGVEAVSHRDLPAITRAIHRSDGLISGGGSLLHDQGSGRPVPYYGGTILLARLLGRPAFVYAQGLGPLVRRHQRWLARVALGAASYVSLRDEASVALLQELGVTRQVDVVPDPVLGLAPFEPAPVTDDPRRQGGGRLVVSLRSWPGSEQWLRPLIAALRLLARQREILLLPLHLPEDVAIAEFVAGQLPRGVHILHPDSYRDAMAAISGAEMVLGMRLHALIFAAVASRPFVAISYDPKVAAFADQVEQPIGADLRVPFSPKTLAGIVDAHGAADHTGYVARVGELRSRATLPARRIVERIRQA